MPEGVVSLGAELIDLGFGKKNLSVKADREDITDNENFGPGDGFVDTINNKLYVLKPGGNKDDFTSNSYEITDLKSLY